MTEPSEPGTRIEYAVRYDEYGPAKVPFYTWIRAQHTGELPPVAMVTTCVAAATLSMAVSAWVWVR